MFNSPNEEVEFLTILQNMKDINTILNKVAVINEELNDFIALMQKDKDGKKYSYTELQNIFMLYKIVGLQESIFNLNNKPGVKDLSNK